MTLGPGNMDVFPQIFFFYSYWPTFVFQLFSLRSFCLRHDSKLRFLSVMTLLHIFSGIFWSLRNDYFYISAILPTSNINCLFYWYYLSSSRKRLNMTSITYLYEMQYKSLSVCWRIFISQASIPAFHIWTFWLFVYHDFEIYFCLVFLVF